MIGFLSSKTAEVMALAAAMIFPLGLVLLKKGYDHSSPLYGTSIVTAINALLLWAIVLSKAHNGISFSSAVLFFIIGGFIGHGLARYLQFIGLHHIGAARNTTLIAGTSAFLGVIVATIFLHEQPTLLVMLGTLALMLGMAFLAQDSKKTKWKPVYILFPLASALLYAIMSTLYKEGLDRLPDAILAGAIGLTAASFAMLLFLIPEIRKNKLPQFNVMKKALPLFGAAGIINTVGLVLNFEALKLVQVSVVHPILNSQPLFATFYGY